MNVTKDDILEALGLQSEANDWIMPMLLGLGVGALLGGTVALMFAPKSGNELREDLRERGRQMMERGRERAQEMAESARNATERMTT